MPPAAGLTANASIAHGTGARRFICGLLRLGRGRIVSASANGAANRKLHLMPVDHPAALRPAVPLPHLRKLAFAIGALLTALALYAARRFFG